MQLVIAADGTIRYVYDELVDLRLLGCVEIRRGSHVEPDVLGRWTADLAPLGGPILGPFTERSTALAAEVTWIEEHWLLDRADG